MMRGIIKKAALSLLPVLVHALVLPSEIVINELRQDTSGFLLESPHYGGPSTFFEYGIISIA